jgi:hypothetical protein
MSTLQGSGLALAHSPALTTSHSTRVTLHCLAMQYELLNAKELGARWKVPESWIRLYSGPSCPKEQQPIPCLRLGRYVRFRWDSPELNDWIKKHLR